MCVYSVHACIYTYIRHDIIWKYFWGAFVCLWLWIGAVESWNEEWEMRSDMCQRSPARILPALFQFIHPFSSLWPLKTMQCNYLSHVACVHWVWPVQHKCGSRLFWIISWVPKMSWHMVIHKKRAKIRGKTEKKQFLQQKYIFLLSPFLLIILWPLVGDPYPWLGTATLGHWGTPK